jgi:predicted ester cyclase
MPRHIAAVALLLMLLTGLLVGQAYNLDRGVRSISPPSSSVETARLFYAAIDQYLQTGEPAGLADLLAPNFGDHTPLTENDQSTTGLFHYLDSLRATFPDLRLEVGAISGQGSTVAANIAFRGKTSGTFAGLSVDLDPAMHCFELLQVENRRIAERWSNSDLPPRFVNVLQIDVPPVPDSIPNLPVERLTIEPDAAISFHKSDGFVLLGETGSASISVESDDLASDRFEKTNPGRSGETSNTERLARILGPNEAIELAPRLEVDIRNEGEEVASVVLVELLHLFPTDRMGGRSGLFQTTPGVERTTLGLNNQILQSQSALNISIGRATMPPGSVISRHAVAMGEEMIVVDGSMLTTVFHGSAAWTRPGVPFKAILDQQIISAGQGIGTNPGSEIEYRAAGLGPTTILFVNVQPT